MIPVRNIRRFITKALTQPGYASSVALHRLGGYARYHIGGGRAPLPESVTIFMTHACNLRCKMCGQWGEKGATRFENREFVSHTLSRDELRSLVDELARHKTNITLFGGEPFLHRDCIETIRHIKSRGLHCLVITNGSLLRSVADELVQSGLDELNLSLDGNGTMHDDIRGIDGLFNRIADGIAAVNEARVKYGTTRPLVNLQCTIMKDNYQRLPELIAAARRFKAHSLTFHHLIHLNDSVYAAQQARMDRDLPGTSSHGWAGFVFEHGMDAELLVTAIHGLTSSAHEIPVTVYPNLSADDIRLYYADPSRVPPGYSPRCLSPWIVGYVFPDGTVRPCLNLDYAFGSIRTSSFHDAWNSPAAIRYRRALKHNKLFPACARCTELYRY